MGKSRCYSKLHLENRIPITGDDTRRGSAPGRFGKLREAERAKDEENAVELKQGHRAGTGTVHGQSRAQDSRRKRAAELLQQFNGPPRFGEHSLIRLQSNRVASETQEIFLGGNENENVSL